MDDLAVDEPTLKPIAADQVGERIVEVLLLKWHWFSEQNQSLKSLLERWRFLVQHESRFDDVFSEEHKRELLTLAAYGKTGLREIVAQDLSQHLETVCGREVMREFAQLVPEFFKAPSGVQHKIHYGELHSAFVEVRLQEMFGLKTTPQIVAGKVPLTFRLLGPNFRPVQVTSDLAGFWRVGYAEVRKELRARYPKHSWPEDPLVAKPEAKGRRR